MSERGVMLKLAIPGSIQEFAFNEAQLKEGVTFGRHPKCVVSLTEGAELVSSRHAKLESRGNEIWIVDGGSTNGTFLNDYQIDGDGARVNHEDVVSFGKKGPRISVFLLGFASVADVARTMEEGAAPMGEMTQMIERAAGSRLSREEKGALKDVAKELARSSSKSRAMMMAVILLLVGAVVAGMVWMLGETKKDVDETKQTAEDAKRDADRAGKDASDANKNAKGARDVANSAQTATEALRKTQDERLEEIQGRLNQLSDAQRKELEGLKESFESSSKLSAAAFKALQKRSQDTEPKTWGNIVADYQKSIFLIYAQIPLVGSDGVAVNQVGGWGTGWLAGNGLVVTNKHVLYPQLFKSQLIEMRDKAREAFKDPTIDWSIEQTIHVAWNHGSVFRKGQNQIDIEKAWVTQGQEGTERRERELRVTYLPPNEMVTRGGMRLHEVNSSADLAVLHLRNTGDLKALPLLPTSKLKDILPTSDVLAIGYPRGAAAITGNIALTSPVTGVIRKNEWQSGVLSTSVPVIPGNSGGPLVDKEGRVIGVTSRGLETTQNDAISIDHVHRLLAAATPNLRGW